MSIFSSTENIFLSGLHPIFVSGDKYGDYGLGPENDCAKDDLFPFGLLSVEFALDDVQKKAFASAFKEHEKVLKKLSGVQTLLLINDRNKVFGENFVFCKTAAAFDHFSEKIEEHRARIVEEWEAEKAAAKAAAAALARGGDPEAVVRTQIWNCLHSFHTHNTFDFNRSSLIDFIFSCNCLF